MFIIMSSYYQQFNSWSICNVRDYIRGYIKLCNRVIQSLDEASYVNKINCLKSQLVTMKKWYRNNWISVRLLFKEPFFSLVKNYHLFSNPSTSPTRCSHPVTRTCCMGKEKHKKTIPEKLVLCSTLKSLK